MLCLWAFFGLPGLDSCRRIPLKARVFVERGVGWIRDLRIIRGLLIVCCARHGWTEIRALLRVGIDEKDVFVGVGFLLAAVVLLLFSVILWTLAAAFAPVNRQVGNRQRRLDYLSPHDVRRARGPPRGCARPVARLAGADESRRVLGADSPQSASRASFAGG